jgi:ASCH domain
LKALSILQPWAITIAREDKLIENRTWRRRVTGRVLIHAGKRYDHDAEQFIQEICAAVGRRVPTLESMREAPRGAIVGVMNILDCVTPLEAQALVPEHARWAFGPWCFRIEWAARFSTPVAYRGELGFFEVPDELVAAQLAEVRALRPEAA